MPNQQLRMFIRESLIVEIGGSMGQDLRYNPMEKGKITKSDPLAGSLVGKKFSFSDGGAPAFVVVADNSQLRKIIVRRYPSYDQAAFSEDVGSLSGATQLDAYADGQAISDAIDQAGGWQSSPDTLSRDAPPTQYTGLSIVPNYWILDRSIQNLKKPAHVSTSSGQEKAKDFGCVVPYETAAAYVVKEDPKTAKFALGAACFYEYANSAKVGLLSAAVGALVGGLIGNVPGAATGAVVGSALTDMLLRWPVLRWALANEKYKFLAANLLLLAVNFIPALIELKFVKGAASKIAPKLATMSASTKAKVTRVVIEMGVQILPDLALHGKQLEEAVLSLLSDPKMIDTELTGSDLAMDEFLKTKYPNGLEPYSEDEE